MCSFQYLDFEFKLFYFLRNNFLVQVTDYETTSQYRLTLQVADPRHPSHTSITQAVIDVENVNEYEPVVDSYIQVSCPL